MRSIIPFTKVEATGNDFILLNDRDIELDLLNSTVIKKWCDRHFGIGADGLIHVAFQDLKIPKMTFFNADGSRGKMCGNGLRAVAKYLLTIGVCSKKSENTIEADDGLHSYFFEDTGWITVELLVNSSSETLPDLIGLPLPDNVELLGFRRVGVPHLVLETKEPEFKNFEALGRSLRYSSVFGTQGTNVNLINSIDENTLQVRTYERGVEAETLSCGTGVTASTLVFLEKKNPQKTELNIETRGGKLKVVLKQGRIFLSGPANVVFVGHIVLNG